MDISTTYLGMKLRSPLVCSASPLSEQVSNIKRMEDAGAGAVVLFSLFEEQIRREREALDHHLSYGTESFAEALSYFPEPDPCLTFRNRISIMPGQISIWNSSVKRKLRSIFR